LGEQLDKLGYNIRWILDTDEFWRIVGDCRLKAESPSDFNSALEGVLRTLSAEEIADFRLRWLAFSDELYSWDVWDASALMLGGTDDDSFMDFRSWVISLGKSTYDLVRDKPDELAKLGATILDAGSPAAEQLVGLPARVYRAVVGQDPPNPPDDSVLTEPFGTRTNLLASHEVAARFPQIYRWMSQAPS
jgi:hypothetical protein